MAQPIQRHFAGGAVKRAIRQRIRTLQAELAQSMRDLDGALLDADELKGFSIHGPFVSSANKTKAPHKHEIHQRVKAEIDSALQANFVVEQEISRLSMIAYHLDDDQIVTLDDDELDTWGLETFLTVAS